MSYHFYNYFERTTPIQTDEGIKARSKRGGFAKNWWAERWITALEHLVNSGRLTRGRSYARKGQVLEIKETKEGFAAKVQGSLPTPYKITIRLKHLSGAEWAKVIDTLAERAIFTAQLLAGEMPQEIEDAFAAAGVSLFPDKRDDLVTSCSCPDYANPCKHVAATHYILGEQFDEDPFLLFRLRGRSQEQIMEALRTRRAADAPILAEEREEYVVNAPAQSLEERIDTFWSAGQPLAGFPVNIRPAATPQPILKRLGQPGFLEESLIRLLGSVYTAIMEKAVAAGYTSEKEATTKD